MKTFRTSFVGCLATAAMALMAPAGWGVPSVSLRIPLDVRQGPPFAVQVVAEGIEAPDELLAFGFNLEYDTSMASFLGFSVAPPFNDDTPMLGGPFGGSAFPGATADPFQGILLGTLEFTALETGIIGIRVTDSEIDPLVTGLFTSGSPERYRIDAQAGVFCIPETASSFALLALGTITIAGLKARSRLIPRH